MSFIAERNEIMSFCRKALKRGLIHFTFRDNVSLKLHSLQSKLVVFNNQFGIITYK